jgi:hypothetical protein
MCNGIDVTKAPPETKKCLAYILERHAGAVRHRAWLAVKRDARALTA